jgi:hypothetical protein
MICNFNIILYTMTILLNDLIIHRYRRDPSLPSNAYINEELASACSRHYNYFTTLEMSYDCDNLRTFKTICPRCNRTRTLDLQVAMRSDAPYLIILLCLTPDNFIRQRKSAATQWVNQTMHPGNPLSDNAP